MTPAKDRHRRDWDELGELDPLWAIASHPGRQFGKWNLEEFFETGEAEVAAVLERAALRDVPRHRDTALDYGCGVGRITRALSKHFAKCVGIDVAPSMIDQARDLHADFRNCEFILASDSGLRDYPADSYDLVWCRFVLMHLPSRAEIEETIRQLIRVTRPGGLTVFQLPSYIPLRHRLQPRRRAYATLRALGVNADFLYKSLSLTPIRMGSLPPAKVSLLVTSAGAKILDAIEDPPLRDITSRTYFVTK